MINRLHIKDFQSHVDTEISFSPHVNVIVGRNMTGKSALLRAIRLIFYNKPEGREFVTWGAKNSIIEVGYGEHVIRRVKGIQNVYEIDGSVFSGFGRTIPAEVVAALGFSSIQVDRNVYELNFDHPHKPPFFISETDATKGKLFSRLGERVLSGLVLLDRSIHVANAELRKSSSERQVLAEQVEIVEESLAGFKPLEDVEESLAKCGESLAKAEALDSELTYLKSSQIKLLTYARDINYLTRLLDVNTSLVDEAIVNANSLSAEISALRQLSVSYFRLTGDICQLEASIKVLKDIPELKLERAVQLSVELHSLLEARISLQANVQNITTIEKHQKELQGVLESALRSYKNLLIRAKKCPLCLRPVEEHDLDTLLEELIGNDTGADTAEGKGSTG